MIAGFAADDGSHLPVSILFEILRVPDLSELWAQEHIGVHTVAELLELDPDDDALSEMGVESMLDRARIRSFVSAQSGAGETPGISSTWHRPVKIGPAPARRDSLQPAPRRRRRQWSPPSRPAFEHPLGRHSVPSFPQSPAPIPPSPVPSPGVMPSSTPPHPLSPREQTPERIPAGRLDPSVLISPSTFAQLGPAVRKRVLARYFPNGIPPDLRSDGPLPLLPGELRTYDAVELSALSLEERVRALAGMSLQERTAALEGLTAEERAAVLAGMSPEERAAALEGLPSELLEDSTSVLAHTELYESPSAVRRSRARDVQRSRSSLRSRQLRREEEQAAAEAKALERAAALARMTPEERAAALARMLPEERAAALAGMTPEERGAALAGTAAEYERKQQLLAGLREREQRKKHLASHRPKSPPPRPSQRSTSRRRQRPGDTADSAPGAATQSAALKAAAERTRASRERSRKLRLAIEEGVSTGPEDVPILQRKLVSLSVDQIHLKRAARRRSASTAPHRAKSAPRLRPVAEPQEAPGTPGRLSLRHLLGKQSPVPRRRQMGHPVHGAGAPEPDLAEVGQQEAPRAGRRRSLSAPRERPEASEPEEKPEASIRKQRVQAGIVEGEKRLLAQSKVKRASKATVRAKLKAGPQSERALCQMLYQKGLL